MKEINQGLRRHLLLTAKLRKQLPPLGYVNPCGDSVARVKFFSPYNGWYWYATEFDGDDTFFGLVNGWELEYGSFSYRELQETVLNLGGYKVPAVERDCGWTPEPVSDIYHKLKAERVRT